MWLGWRTITGIGCRHHWNTQLLGLGTEGLSTACVYLGTTSFHHRPLDHPPGFICGVMQVMAELWWADLERPARMG